MKKSLLLISLFFVLEVAASGQGPSKAVRNATPAAMGQKPQHAADATSSKKATKKHSRKKKKKERQIDHPAPDQAKIDSIKNEKMKHKK